MYFNLVVMNCDDVQVEYEWETASDFMEAVENPDAQADDKLPMFDDPVITLDYSGNDCVSWNEEDLEEHGIKTVYDVYQWLCGDNCHWFD